MLSDVPYLRNFDVVAESNDLLFFEFVDRGSEAELAQQVPFLFLFLLLFLGGGLTYNWKCYIHKYKTVICHNDLRTIANYLQL